MSNNDDVVNEPNKKTQIARKANHDIGFTIKAGSMDFITRKIHTTLIYYAQRAKDRKGLLPAGEWDIEPESAQHYWWIPMSNLIADASIGKRQKLVFELLDEMQGVRVHRTGLGETGLGMQSEHLIGGVRLVPAINPKKNTPGWLVGWNFPVGMESFFLHPSKYTRISLWYQSRLNSESSLALYELCRRCAEWEVHATSKFTWQELQARLVTSTTPRETYKEFKRDTLNKAIKEINEKTDIRIELEEIKASRGRGVEFVRFNSYLEPQGDLELTPDLPPIPNAPIVTALESAGVSLRVAASLVAEYGDVVCKQNLDLFYLSGPGQQKPKTTGWLVTAIRNNYASGELAKKKLDSKKAAAATNLLESRIKESSSKVESLLTELPEGDALEAAWDDFRSSSHGKIFKPSATFATASTPARQAFSGWWGNQQSNRKALEI